MSRVAFTFHNALTRWEFSPFALLVLAAAIVAASWYLRAEWTLSTRGRRWSGKRTALLHGRPGGHRHRPAVAGEHLHHGLLPGPRHPAPAVDGHRTSPAGHGGPDDPGPPDVEPGRQGQAAGRPQLPAVQGAHPPASGVVPLLLLDVRLLPDLRPRFRHDPHVGHGSDQSGLPLRLDAVLVAHGRCRPDPPLEDEPRGAGWPACSSACRWNRSWPWPSSATTRPAASMYTAGQHPFGCGHPVDRRRAVHVPRPDPGLRPVGEVRGAQGRPIRRPAGCGDGGQGDPGVPRRRADRRRPAPDGRRSSRVRRRAQA